MLVIGVIVGVSSSVYFFLDGNNEVTNNSYADKIMLDCKTNVDCAIDYLRDVSQNEEKSTVLATFDDLISKYETSVRYCHIQGHHMGMYLYDYIGDLPQALSYVDQRCAGSIIHGVIQGYFMKNFNSTNQSEIDVKRICPLMSDNPYDIKRWECLHGMGHGLMATYNYDVFLAVQNCEELEPGWEQTSCAKGIFMENQNVHKKSGKGTFDENDLFFPCNKVDVKFMPSCYNYHASYLFSKSGFSINNTFMECEKIIPEEFAKYCYFGIGRQLSVRAFDDVESSFSICPSGKPHYQSYCFAGLTLVILDLKGTDQAFKYCKFFPEHAKSDCYDVVGKWIQMLHETDEEKKLECTKAENSYYFEVCMKADLEGIVLL